MNFTSFLVDYSINNLNGLPFKLEVLGHGIRNGKFVET